MSSTAAATRLTAPLGKGAQMVTPPPSVPLGFLFAAGVGLVGFGLAAWFAADTAVFAPTLSGVVSAVHVCVLAFLTTAALGALHQFAPVVGQRPMRSVLAARVTLVAMVAAAWLLPTGFAHGPENLVIVGGLLGATAVAIAAWNLSAPLSSRVGGLPIIGLRFSMVYLVITVGFGVVYAIDRQTEWFPLLSHRVLAHAHLGLLGWLGLTYLAVAEKLWPMFLLAHRPGQRAGAWAIGLVAAGAALLTPGLLFAFVPIAALGALLACGGLVAHLISLGGAVKHRRRPLELLHAFLFLSAAFLVAAMVIGLLAGMAPVSTLTRTRLVSAEIAALMAWLGLAIVGHVHKIVPFIAYTTLRKRGVRTNAQGGPLMFSDLFDARLARVSLVLGATGFGAVVAGLLSGTAAIVSVGGAALAITGVVTMANLTSGPLLAQRSATPQPNQSIPAARTS